MSHSGAQPVGVEPGGGAGDPAAGAVGGGAAAVEGGGELPGHERAAVLDGEGPDPVQRARLVGEQPGLDLDARGAQGLGAAGGDRVGVGLGDDHPAYAGREQGLRARTGAAGVVARLERDHGRGAAGRRAGPGQGVDLGVRAAGAAVVALGDACGRRRRAGRSRPAGWGRGVRRGSPPARGRGASPPARAR